MYRVRRVPLSSLRRFVGGRGRRREPFALIAEAVRLLILPSLRDVLAGAAAEPEELHLTYAAACVVIADLLAQRFEPAAPQQAAAAALRRLGEGSGFDEAQLTGEATTVIRQFQEIHPEVHRGLCGRFDAAIERAVVMGERAQGEVLLRLALESFETAIQQLVMGQPTPAPGPIHGAGLLAVVRRRWPVAQGEAAA